MSEYRMVIAATVIITLGLCGLMLVLDANGSTMAASLVLVGLGILDLLATVYILRLVYQDQRRPRSWLLLFLATGAVFITAGFAIIEFLILRRLSGLPPLEGSAGIVLTSLGLILIGCVPVMKAVLFYVVRHSSHSGPRIEDQA